MTILEAIQSFTAYPVKTNFIEKICVDRGLTSSDDYTVDTTSLDAFRLATADLYVYLYTAPDLREQQVSITLDDRKRFLSLANIIYGELDDAKFNGGTFGFVGEDWNA